MPDDILPSILGGLSQGFNALGESVMWGGGAGNPDVLRAMLARQGDQQESARRQKEQIGKLIIDEVANGFLPWDQAAPALQKLGYNTQNMQLQFQENPSLIYKRVSAMEGSRDASGMWTDQGIKRLSSSGAPSLADQALKERSVLEQARFKQQIVLRQLKEQEEASKLSADEDIAPQAEKVSPASAPPAPVDQSSLEQPKQTVDPASGALVQSFQPKAIEERPLPQSETDPERVVQTDEHLITAPATPETPDSLRLKAQAKEMKASKLRRLGTSAGVKQANEAMKEAKDLRSASVALETRIQKETALEQSAERTKITQQPLTEEAVGFVVTQALKGNMQAISGFARNQVAKKQIADALPVYAKALGMDPEAANVAVMKFHAANRTETDFAAGQAARNITAINTAIGHMGTMSRLADAMGSGNVQSMNYIMNQVRTQFGNPSITNFEIAKSAVSDELMRVFRQVGASQTEVEKWESKFSAAQTPQQIKEGLNTASSLLHSRIDALQEQYKRGTGRTSADVLTKESRQALKEISGKAVRTPPMGTKSRASERSHDEEIKPFEDQDKELRYQEWKRIHGY